MLNLIVYQFPLSLGRIVFLVYIIVIHLRIYYFILLDCSLGGLS